jgi:phosphate transport system permease protein
MLALARAMGETAPLLFTALFSDYLFDGKLGEPIASLAVLIYNFSGSPFENQVNLAWAASLVLVVSVLVVNVIAQLVTRRQEEH